MQHDVDVKSELCTVRLTTRQVEVLDGVAHGELNRSQVVRMLVEDFVRRPEKERQAFVVRQLFGETAAQ
jgi:hypothetical protein